uniref:Uncharacterized protein n=1 Tax=Timema shepardi TaxID=629360 RepID=A0A7R9ARW7_TIMSH|nr:unnamed protein product [Timema shepardi]
MPASMPRDVISNISFKMCSSYSGMDIVIVPDSEGSPGMDCLPLQRSPGPFHYLIHEQAKSLVALQELQNEVGALLEFRDLVMETFPHLRNKMAPMTSPLASSIPVPRGSREWEPGVRVRRKLAKEQQQDSSSLVARNRPGKQHQQQHQPKSGGDTSGTSSAGSSAVQDSGFSTETSSSSKDPSHTSSTTSAAPVAAPRLGSPKSVVAAPTPQGVPSALDEAEDELWNLLDVIHRKGTRLRDEVEHLTQRLQVSEQREVRRRSLDGSDLQHHDHHHQPDQRPGSRRGLLGGDRRCDSLDEEEIRGLRRERDVLLDKVAEMEAETLASRMKTSELQSELRSLVAAKRDLEEQLRATVSQKSELNSRIHDLHLQFVTSKQVPGSSNNPSDQTPGTGRGLGFSPMRRLSDERKQLQRSTQTSPARSPTLRSDPDAGVGTRSPRGGVSVKKPLGTLNRMVGESVPDSGSVFVKNTLRTQSGEIPIATSVNIGTLDGADLALAVVKKPLGALDGIVSSPSCLRRNSRGVVPDPQKVSAILQEFNPVELQRHLITTAVEKQVRKNSEIKPLSETDIFIIISLLFQQTGYNFVHPSSSRSSPNYFAIHFPATLPL